ncbi:MAG: helix-turn-helix domain-containing protein [Halodesulfurarchaeum sp.]
MSQQFASKKRSDSTEPSERLAGPPLEATLAIEPNTRLDCPLFEGSEIEHLRQSLSFESTDAVVDNSGEETGMDGEKTDGGEAVATAGVGKKSGCEPTEGAGMYDRPTRPQGTCNTSMGPAEEGSDTFVSSQITPGCFCLQFHHVECIPAFERTTHDSVIVSVQVPDRAALRELIERLRATDAHVSVRGISRRSGEDDGTIRIDTSEVTDKQLEALEVAVETGYYETPRCADLDVLADRLGVSKSAVSQRLKAVESRFARKLVAKYSGQ